MPTRTWTRANGPGKIYGTEKVWGCEHLSMLESGSSSRKIPKGQALVRNAPLFRDSIGRCDLAVQAGASRTRSSSRARIEMEPRVTSLEKVAQHQMSHRRLALDEKACLLCSRSARRLELYAAVASAVVELRVVLRTARRRSVRSAAAQS